MPLSWTIPSSWAISVLVASSTMKSLPIDWTWFWCERKCTHDLWCAWWCTNIPRHWNLSLGTLEDRHLSSEWFQQAIFELQKNKIDIFESVGTTSNLTMVNIWKSRLKFVNWWSCGMGDGQEESLPTVWHWLHDATCTRRWFQTSCNFHPPLQKISIWQIYLKSVGWL